MANKKPTPAEIEAALATPSKTITVVQTKAMGMQEKTRIEKLLENRATALTGYLGEMKEFALEANEHQEFSGESIIEQTAKDVAQLGLENERLHNARKGEIEAVKIVLEDEFELKLKRLAALETKLKTKQHEALQAATEEITEKYQDEEDKIQERELELKANLQKLRTQKSREKMVRKVTLANSFRALEDGIADAKNKAAEQLYTQVQAPAEAQAVLAQIPDATRFRQQVSPEKLFDVFNRTSALKGLPTSQACCNKCGSDDLQENPRNGQTYCRGCGAMDVLSAEVKNLVMLPSIDEIVNSNGAIVDHPVEAAPAPKEEEDGIDQGLGQESAVSGGQV